MTIRPRLNVICGRCGRRREGLRHVCRSNSRRRATVRLAPVLGGCARCGKTYGGRNGNPLTHVCRPRDGDYRRRKAEHQRKIRTAARARTRAAERDKQQARITAVRERERQRSRARHEYQSCKDEDCQRPVCVAFKQGYKDGYRDGYEDGFEQGYARGFSDGIAACPRAHQ